MGKQLFSNNASSELSGALAQAGTTAVLSAGTGARFPAPVAPDYFIATIFEKDDAGNEINIEIVKVTARTADTLTIERDFESVAGVAGGYSYPSAVGKTVYIDLRWTAFAASNGLRASANLADLDDITAAKTTLGIENVDNTDDASKPISTLAAAALANKEDANKKDASGGYAGLTLFKLNLKNAAGSVVNWLTTVATSTRTWTFPDKDGTVAMLSDITGTNSGVNTGDQTLPTLSSLGAQATSAKDAAGGYVGLTSLKINFKNTANTITSWLTNSNTAARTYTFRDRNGTIADDTDLALKANLASPVFSGKVGIGVTPHALMQNFLTTPQYAGIQAGSYSSNLGYYDGTFRSPYNHGWAGFWINPNDAGVCLYIAPPNTGAADAAVPTSTAIKINNNGNIEIPNTLVLSQYTEKTYYPETRVTAHTFSFENGSIQRFQTAGSITITLPASVAGKSAIIEIQYGGAHAVTFAGGTAIKYPNGVAPTTSSTTGKIDRYCIEQDGSATLISDAGRKF